MSYLAPGGPRLPGMRPIFQQWAQTGRVTAVSVTTWNPEMDEDKQSETAVMGLLADLLK